MGHLALFMHGVVQQFQQSILMAEFHRLCDPASFKVTVDEHHSRLGQTTECAQQESNLTNTTTRCPPCLHWHWKPEPDPHLASHYIIRCSDPGFVGRVEICVWVIAHPRHFRQSFLKVSGHGGQFLNSIDHGVKAVEHRDMHVWISGLTPWKKFIVISLSEHFWSDLGQFAAWEQSLHLCKGIWSSSGQREQGGQQMSCWNSSFWKCKCSKASCDAIFLKNLTLASVCFKFKMLQAENNAKDVPMSITMPCRACLALLMLVHHKKWFLTLKIGTNVTTDVKSVVSTAIFSTLFNQCLREASCHCLFKRGGWDQALWWVLSTWKPHEFQQTLGMFAFCCKSNWRLGHSCSEHFQLATWPNLDKPIWIAWATFYQPWRWNQMCLQT